MAGWDFPILPCLTIHYSWRWRWGERNFSMIFSQFIFHPVKIATPLGADFKYFLTLKFGSFGRYWANLSKVGDMINIFNLTNFVSNPRLAKEKNGSKWPKCDERKIPGFLVSSTFFSISCSLNVLKSLNPW